MWRSWLRHSAERDQRAIRAARSRHQRPWRSPRRFRRHVTQSKGSPTPRDANGQRSDHHVRRMLVAHPRRVPRRSVRHHLRRLRHGNGRLPGCGHLQGLGQEQWGIQTTVIVRAYPGQWRTWKQKQRHSKPKLLRKLGRIQVTLRARAYQGVSERVWFNVPPDTQ